MATISLILLVLAFGVFLFAASGWAGDKIHRATAVGLACWVLSVLLGGVHFPK